MTLVRFFFLMGMGTFITISLLYLERVFGIEDGDERSMLWMAALVGVGVVALALVTFLLIGVHPRRDPRTSERTPA